MAQQLTTEILNSALENLTAKRQHIDEQIAEVRRLLGGSKNGAASAPDAAPVPARHKRRMSAAGRRAIAEAQKRRWAEQKAAAGVTPATAPKRRKRKLSPEGRQAIVDALKKRWAAKGAGASKKSASKAAA